MKVTSAKTYQVIRAILEMKSFTQYEISKKEKVTFSVVNRVVNWLVTRGYVVKRTGRYELIAAGAVFSLFPLYRKMKPKAVFDVDISSADFLKLIKGKGVLALTSALAFYDDYFRDPAIHVYLKDNKLQEVLKSLPKGYTHIEIYDEDLPLDDSGMEKNQLITSKIRTVIDLFCSNKAYAAERLIKREWG